MCGIPLHALRYTLRKISCTLQIARAEKLLKNLRGGLRGALLYRYATPRCALRCSAPQIATAARNSASAAPQNQLQFTNCTCPKIC